MEADGQRGCSRGWTPAQLLALPVTFMVCDLASRDLSFSAESVKAGLAASYVVACVWLPNCPQLVFCWSVVAKQAPGKY